MINRVLIRIRVAQIAYAYFQNHDQDIKKAENELLHSLEKSYELYFYLMLLVVETTKRYQKRIAQRKSRKLPTLEDINPDLKLAENRFAAMLAKSVTLAEFADNNGLSWEEEENYVRSLLENILASDIYREYAKSGENSFAEDRDFWRKVFKQIICDDENLDALLEDQSLYWNDDVEIVQSFVIKSIKKVTAETDDEALFMPMYKDKEDKDFARKLLTTTLREKNELREIIDQHAQNWESERIALMDMVVMQIATCELLHFPEIPVNVTLNEYIDIVKAYSTAKSAGFINGILDAVVQDLKKEKRLVKV